ncbi:unnamed protein product [Parascedosporium putredinis]|uniref:PhnB-like domain-containing protein n=1 Tax=Parascedosporium putredinis TaxID=1442378 RepID=A0A9P1ME37_9PEZI|nr:unnamed protein product [Parascedosporium putredinis]CAI8004883.1 unnamed protein product [Parascedosporium putredinis]
MSLNKLSTCLWFNNKDAMDAAEHYTSIFNSAPGQPASGPKSSIHHTQRFPEDPALCHGAEPGSVMVVDFDLRGQRFVGLNGGDQGWGFNAAVSFQIFCEDQDEVDHFWEKLSEGGDVSKQECGWLADKFGVTWQVIPRSEPVLVNTDVFRRKTRDPEKT